MIIQVCDVCRRVVGKAEKLHTMPVDGKLMDMCPECAQETVNKIKKAQLELTKDF